MEYNKENYKGRRIRTLEYQKHELEKKLEEKENG